MQKPEAPDAGPAGEDGAGDRYRRVMRALLQRDYFTTGDWDTALRDLARMAKAALQARETLVGLYDPELRCWLAVTSQGRLLGDDEISNHGSRSLLERVRQTEAPLLAGLDEELNVDSASIRRHQVGSALAVPLYWWSLEGRSPRRDFGGCLYAHRSVRDESFSLADVELLGDLTEVAQRTLNVLRRLRTVEADLELSRQRLRRLQEEAAGRWRLGRYVTQDPAFYRNVLSVLQRVATAPRVNLLLLGPTGSGKSYLAQAFHYESPRRQGPFVVLDCAQVTSAETLGAELFGYAPHSGFANAPPRGRPGAAEAAHGGTLFLDEISAIPPEIQQRLLGLLQTGSFSRLGTSERRTVDVQVVAATNEDPRALVHTGRFREDLLWRLMEVAVELPSLTERLADVPHLAEGFFRSARERFGRTRLESLSEEAMHVLLSHDWSGAGNIRGLEHAIHRSVLLAPPQALRLEAKDLQLLPGLSVLSSRARPAALPERTKPPAAEEGAAAAWRTPVRDHSGQRELLLRKIEQHGGVLSAVATDAELARALGHAAGSMPPSSLRLYVRRWELDGAVSSARRRRKEALGQACPDVAELEAAVRQHGSGTAAARALGLTRDVLVWHLRQAGRTIRQVLASGPAGSGPA
jgi:transcriptional regulator with GAF, ATPase, and Fis domain